MWREYELLCLASMRHHSGVPGQIRLLMAEMRLNFSKTSRKLKLISATQTSGKFGGKWVFVQNVLDKYAVIEQIFYTYRRNTQKFKKIYTTAKKLQNIFVFVKKIFMSLSFWWNVGCFGICGVGAYALQITAHT